MGRTVGSGLAALAIGAATLGVAVAGAPAAGAIPVPEGFTDELVAPVATPTGLAELGDGRILVLSKPGSATIVSPDGTAVPALQIPAAEICSSGEQGLLGAAVAGTRVFLYITVPGTSCAGGSATNEVREYRLAGDQLTYVRDVISGMETSATNHNGGDLHIAADGFLYIANGDGGATPTWAQDRFRLNGKISRVTLDGEIPTTNPFAVGGVRCATGPAKSGQTCAEIYALGLRNPFRMAFDEDAAAAGQVQFRINDVGDGSWEEIDESAAGANYGWPTREGPCPRGQAAPCPVVPPASGFTDPVHSYPHSSGCRSITGGAFVPDGAWPGYDGAYLYADFVCRQLFALSGTTAEAFSATAGQIIDIEMVLEGGAWVVYYTTFIDGGQLRRITPPPTEPPPPPAPPTDAGRFVPVTPTRVLDTREGVGAPATKPGAATAVAVQVEGDVVPPEAVAVALNLTITEPDAPGYATAYPTGSARPGTSDVNVSAASEVAANAAAVALDADGQVSVFTYSSAHLVADVTGYWVPAANATDGRFTTITPARLLDTRESGRIGADTTVTVPVLGQGEVPTSGVAGVALTVTYTDVGEPGYVTVWPSGQPRPLASTLNPNGAGDIRSNLVMLPVGGDGAVEVYTYADAQLVVDVVGWLTDATAADSTTGLFVAASRARLLDTRSAGPPDAIPADGTLAVDLAASVPADSSAALVNLTATNTTGGGYFTVFPASGAAPLASTVNWSGPAQSRAAAALVTPQHTVYAYDDADAVVDLSGWFTG